MIGFWYFINQRYTNSKNGYGINTKNIIDIRMILTIVSENSVIGNDNEL